jgi:hypothetical protein
MINIILSPSQQSSNRCAMGDSEEDHCHQIGRVTFELLKEYECNALLIPKKLSNLQEVVNMSNEFVTKNTGLSVTSFHLDIHTDAGYDGKGSSGYYYSENGRQFISIVQNEVAKITPWLDGNIIERGSLYVLSHTKAIAGLIELSFHDRMKEAKHMHENISLYAKALMNGLVRACGLKKKIDSSLASDVDKLVTKEIIQDRNYWIVNNQYDTANVRRLIHNMAEKI